MSFFFCWQSVISSARIKLEWGATSVRCIQNKLNKGQLHFSSLSPYSSSSLPLALYLELSNSSSSYLSTLYIFMFSFFILQRRLKDTSLIILRIYKSFRSYFFSFFCWTLFFIYLFLLIARSRPDPDKESQKPDEVLIQRSDSPTAMFLFDNQPTINPADDIQWDILLPKSWAGVRVNWWIC